VRTRKPGRRKSLAGRKLKVTVEPSRAAIAALERVRALLARTDKVSRFGEPVTMRELAARANLAGRPLPPSYVSAMRVTSSIGPPEDLLSAVEMETALRDVITSRGAAAAADAKRYLPFCRAHDGEVYYCFDQRAATTADGDAELGVVEWQNGQARAVATHFGEWIDAIADEREERLEQAANMSKSLRDLLLHLGFRFEDPIVGKLVTGDVAAVEALLGAQRTRETRGAVNRLFDATGKAQLTLNVDDFTLALAVRTGTVLFEAEDVFRWLRTFRDENFFGESYREPSHPDQVRDLRKAGREAPLVLRGVLEVATMPAAKHFFCDASGPSTKDFHLLGRGMGQDRGASLILHVKDDAIRSAHTFDGPLHSIYASESGILWGLSNQSQGTPSALGGQVVRFAGGEVRSFPLPRAAGSLTWWYGIGEIRGRIVVWGTGSLLEFDGNGFAPFQPDARLERHEAVVALCPGRHGEAAMLVCSEHAGAVARFDGREWLPIDEEHLLEADLADFDVWRGVGIVLARTGEVWRVESGVPRAVPWDPAADAFVDEAGQPRRVHAVRGFDGGALVATDGGVIAVGGEEPVFHSAGAAREPARLARVGESSAEAGAMVVATFGPHVWLWQNGTFLPFDVRTF